MSEKILVLDEQGNELKPTNRNARVRLLLKEHKAKIVNYDPFTIQLRKEVIGYADIKKFGSIGNKTKTDTTS